MPTYDINTSDVTVDGTPPGATFRPLRYTQSQRDDIRVGLWMEMSTIKGSYRMRVDNGLDVEAILDPSASDAERRALVSDVVLRYPGVTAIIAGPTISIDEETGMIVSISFTAQTEDGTIIITT